MFSTSNKGTRVVVSETAQAEDQHGLSPLRKRLQRLYLLGVLAGLAVAGFLVWSNREALMLTKSALMSSQTQGLAQVTPVRSPFQEFDLRNATIPRERIAHGGPPVDGIPSLTNPKFVSAREATWLKSKDRVIGVVFEGEARAYPLKILDRHEAVNDRIGKTSFAVTYCPLCDSAAVFDRRTKEGELEFGISGLLYNSNVLLYDRRKSGQPSLWSQMKIESVAGPQVGKTLRTLPLELTTFKDWSSRYPQTLVLSTETGHRRDYDQPAYGRYFRSPRLMFPVEPLDRRLPLKTSVLGIWSENAAQAYPVTAFDDHTESMQIQETLDGRKLTLAYNPEAKSLRVVQADDGLEWMYAFWFAWAAFHPETDIYVKQRPAGAKEAPSH